MLHMLTVRSLSMSKKLNVVNGERAPHITPSVSLRFSCLIKEIVRMIQLPSEPENLLNIVSVLYVNLFSVVDPAHLRVETTFFFFGGIIDSLFN